MSRLQTTWARMQEIGVAFHVFPFSWKLDIDAGDGYFDLNVGPVHFGLMW